MGKVKVSEDAVVLEEIECRDGDVVGFMGELTEAERPEAVCRALSLGVAGLRSVSARADVDQVERGFEQLKREFQRAFDPERKSSYLGQLTEAVDGYLGDDGAVASAVAENGDQVVKTILDNITQLRDAVITNIATAVERDKGTAKGGDFETEVEDVLCRVARAYGDGVTNVAAEAGEAGRSKRGDFVVTLAEGPRFTIESKNRSTITLRGSNGILAELDASMLNRQADFAIAVSKSADALPKEVGAFNAYDEDKVVCAYGDDGAMLEVAYRWARTQLLLGLEEPESDVDVDAVRSSLDDARQAVVELAKIKAKASTITETANDIQNVVEWQVARAKAALGQAEQALEVEFEAEAEAS